MMRGYHTTMRIKPNVQCCLQTSSQHQRMSILSEPAWFGLLHEPVAPTFLSACVQHGFLLSWKPTLTLGSNVGSIRGGAFLVPLPVPKRTFHYLSALLDGHILDATRLYLHYNVTQHCANHISVDLAPPFTHPPSTKVVHGMVL